MTRSHFHDFGQILLRAFYYEGSNDKAVRNHGEGGNGGQGEDGVRVIALGKGHVTHVIAPNGFLYRYFKKKKYY